MGRLTRLPSLLSSPPALIGVAMETPAERDRERAAFYPWRALYKTARWTKLRLKILRRDRFTCRWPGCGRIVAESAGLVCDHRRPHRGDLALFWDEDNLWTLCKPCHDGPKQALERSGAFDT